MYHINILIRGGHGPRFTNENSFNKQLQEKFIIFFNVLVFILHMGLRHFGISLQLSLMQEILFLLLDFIDKWKSENRKPLPGFHFMHLAGY